MELKLGSIPVQITGRFIFMALILGMNEIDLVKLVIWLGIVLVSVLIHELGHALVGKAFGLVPRIVLHGMGGHTFFEPGAPGAGADKSRSTIGPGKSIAISLAGPFAGFIFAGVIIVAQIAGLHPAHPLAIHTIRLLMAVNIGWGVFNLLPMLPLDGGNVMRSILSAITKDKADKIARVVSIAIAGAIALWALKSSQWWVLYLGVLFGFQNVQALRHDGQTRVDQALATAIEQAHQALDRKEPHEAIHLLAPVLTSNSGSMELRQLGVRIYIVAMLKEARFTDALGVIERERSLITAEDLEQYARAMRETGHADEAQRIESLKAPPALSEFRA